MSCNIGIYDICGITAPRGGNWFYVGYHATSSSGPFTQTPAIPLISSPANTLLIGWGDNFSLNTAGKSPGYYRLRYQYSNGSDDIDIHVVNGSLCAGIDSTVNWSVTIGGTLSLTSYLVGPGCAVPASGGVWENVDGASGFNASTGVLTVATAGVGTFRFNYRLSEYDLANCDDCKAVATVTVVLSAGFSGTVTRGTASCLYEMVLTNHILGELDAVNFSVSQNDLEPLMSYNITVYNCRDRVFLDKIVSIRQSTPYTYTLTNAMSNGGFIKTLRLRTTLGTDVNIPLSPTTAIFNGVGGSTNATELTYNSASPQIFYNAISKAIRNYLGTLGYTDGVQYKLYRVGQNSGNRVEIGFHCKHNPSSLWIGLSKTAAVMTHVVTAGGGDVTINGSNFTALPFSFSEAFTALPCFQDGLPLSITVNQASTHVSNTSDFNSIVLSSNNVVVNKGLFYEKSCVDTQFTFTSVGCSGTVSYAWTNGGGTLNNIIVPTIVGQQYTLTATCTSPASSVIRTVTI